MCVSISDFLILKENANSDVLNAKNEEENAGAEKEDAKTEDSSLLDVSCASDQELSFEDLKIQPRTMFLVVDLDA